EFNESSIRLTRKFELSKWTATFQRFYSQTEVIAKDLVKALAAYQKQVSIFIRLGGKRLIDLGNSDIDYRGTNIENYLNRLLT
ncbi:hypothetical protein ACYT4N_12820, partial [Lactococcus lactis]